MIATRLAICHRTKWALAVALLVCAACAEDPARIEAAELGPEWPLTVEVVTLGCEGSMQSPAPYFELDNGARYALNGLAKSRLRLPFPEELQKPDPAAPGVRMSTDKLRRWAEALCRKAP